MIKEKQLKWCYDRVYLDDKIQNVINTLTKYLSSEYGNPSIEYYVDDYSCDTFVRYQRLETDAELEDRIVYEQKLKEQRRNLKQSTEESEKAEYERLKKKYGG